MKNIRRSSVENGNGKIMPTETLQAAINKSIQRHQINGADAKVIYSWVEGAVCQTEILAALELGLIEFHGVRNGYPTIIKAGSNQALSRNGCQT